MVNNVKVKDGIIHVHSENSLKDSAASVESLCKRAFELGAPAITLTDHGNLFGAESFFVAISSINNAIDICEEARTDSSKCKKCKYSSPEKCKKFKENALPYIENHVRIKAIPGVEAYFEEDDDVISKRAHLLLIAKDKIGYKMGISKAVTDSNRRLDSAKMPRMNAEILEKRFGNSSPAHGHVFAGSACMVGVLSNILLSNSYIEAEIAKHENAKKKLNNPNDASYQSNLKTLEEIESSIAALNEEIKTMQALAKKPYTKKEKSVKALEGTAQYDERRAALDAEEAESENAKVNLEKAKAKKIALSAQLRAIKETCKAEEKDHDKWYNLNNSIERLRNTLASEDELYKKAEAMARKYVEIFGEGNFFCEVQYHGIDKEAYVMPKIAKIAAELNIPLVATNDAHMVSNTANEVKARQIMRSLRFNRWEDVSDSDKELYLKTDKELSDSLLKILPLETVEKSMRGIKYVTDACDIAFVKFEKETHYPVYKSEIEGEGAAERLSRLCREGISWRYPNAGEWTDECESRLSYELSVIEKLGFSDYLNIVEDFLKYGRLVGKLDYKNPDPRFLADPYNIELLKEITKDCVGVGIGPGRGSAVGSLVCYLTGITSVDPMKYGLLFARFLSEERVTMPDIDSDFSVWWREKVLSYVKHKYGEDGVCCIMTKGTQSARAVVRNAARLLGSELYDDTTTFYDLGDEIAKSIPAEVGIKIGDCLDELKKTYANNENALKIIENALCVEGTFVNVGMHAAGVIIADNGNVSDYIPLMYNTDKNQWMTQCDKEQAESAGLLKMDFLGLKNLSIMDDAVKNIYKRHGIKIDINALPFEDVVFKKIFACGNTNSVFQFESDGMKRMLRQFQPESFEDIILLVAAYRPGPMQYLDDIIAVKHKRKAPEYVIPEMEEVLGPTYGSSIYQEQIMKIFNRFAGFSLGESDIIRRYMSKKKTEKFIAYKDKFVDGMVKRGASEENVEIFWNQLVEFSKYAFNRSHAAAYAMVAYQTAWLKYHYPTEYLCAVMNYTEFKKMSMLIGDAKNMGVRICAPDINESENEFAAVDNYIVCGLGSVKNVGDSASAYIKERNKNGKFISFVDFLLRTKPRRDVLESLIYAGAFDCFEKNRKSLVGALDYYCDLVKKISDKEKCVADESTSDEKKARAKTAIETLVERMNAIFVESDVEEDAGLRLAKEKEMIGGYMSAHPLDPFKTPEEYGCTPIAQVSKGKLKKVFGFVTDFRIANRKSDGAQMAFFTLEDKTGTMEINCFTKCYAKYKSILDEGAIVKITGTCNEETVSFGDEEDVITKLNAETIEKVDADKKPVILYVKSIPDWTENIYPLILPYLDRSGHPLVIYDKLTGQFRKTGVFVSKQITQNSVFETTF